MLALGGRCAGNGCGVNDVRLLTVDHVNGDGAAHRGRRVPSPWVRWGKYLKAIESGSHALQLLCFNCHALKDLMSKPRVRPDLHPHAVYPGWCMWPRQLNEVSARYKKYRRKPRPSTAVQTMLPLVGAQAG